MQLLRRKAWQVSDLDRHPVCLGVPLGQDGGDAKAVSVDCGLKTMASVSLGDLVDSSGRKTYLMGAVREIFQELHTEPQWKGAKVGIASSCDEPSWARLR